MTPEEAIARYQAAYGRLRADTVQRVLALWAVHGGLGVSDSERFTAAVVPVVTGGQIAVARLVAGYFAIMARLVAGSAPTAAVDVATVTTTAMRGVPAAEVYHRPVVTARTAVSEGKPVAQALDIARDRLERIADTDIALAQRQATVQVIGSDDRIVGYRRVLTGSSCALCATASTQRYRTGELMPIHGRCDCGVAPIFGTADPGQVINRQLVRDLRAAAKQTGVTDAYRNRRVAVDADGTVRLPDITVRRHGELGPTLTQAGESFTGPGAITAA